MHFEEISKFKAIGCNIRNCTKYSVMGEEYHDCYQPNKNKDYCLAIETEELP